MKKLLFFLISGILLEGGCKMASAQSDSVRVSFSEEYPDSSNYNFKRKYQYVDLNMRNEKDLLKFGVVPIITSLDDHIVACFRIGYERKLSTSLSIDVKTSHNLSKTITNSLSNVDLRYYYAVKRKVKDGVSGDNLNNNFYCLGFGSLILLNHLRMDSQPTLSFGWGLQRRLGRLGYFDGSFLLNRDIKNTIFYSGLTFTINLEIGIGFNLIHKK